MRVVTMHLFSAGSTSTMFGSQQTPTQQGSPSFGSGSQLQTSGPSMFETSSQAPASTAFGQSTQSQSSTSPFGAAATFGTSAGKEMFIHFHFARTKFHLILDRMHAVKVY